MKIGIKNLLKYSLILCLLSCKSNENEKLLNKDAKIKEVQFIETLIDSINVADRGKYKLFLQDIRDNESCYLNFTLFKKENNKWIETQKYRFEKSGVVNANPKFLDFNNDGFNDMTIESRAWARGSNEGRTLFVFNKEIEQFVCIKNSDMYPNLAYNKALNCIDALMVYAGTSTIFLKIEKDSLKKFAEVELFNEIIKVSIIDKNGDVKIIRENKAKENECFIRYKNFNPLEGNIYKNE